MQKLLRFFAAAVAVYALLMSAPASAQTATVPNGDFETWSTRNNAPAPDNWLTIDDFFRALLPIPLPFSISNVTRSTDRHSGSYAAKIETTTLAFGGDTLPGTLALGTAVGNPFRLGLPGGAPFTGRPQELKFYYKLTGANALGDSAQVLLSSTRYVNGTPELVAVAGPFILAPTTTYTQVTVPITYADASAPDSLQIVFTSSGNSLPHPGTALYIDDITLNGTALATRTKVEADLRLYPNPSTSGIFELNTSEAILLSAPLTVTDATGRVVLREETGRANATRRLDLSSRPAGIYTLQISTSEGVVTRKLVVQ